MGFRIVFSKKSFTIFKPFNSISISSTIIFLSTKKDGIIFFHDLLPRSFYEENVPRKQSKWSGDVWKVAVELNNSKNVEFKIVNIDHGIGILKLKKKEVHIKKE